MGMGFDDQAAAYDRWYATPLGALADRVEKEALFALLPPVAGLRLLEVGCGTGNISLALAAKGAEVVGLDASAAMLARAQAKARGTGVALSLVRGAAGQLPFAAESFDGVLCILALDFMTDREGALREMVRVLRPGGFLTVAVLNLYSLWALKRLLKARLRPSLWRGVQFLTPAGLQRLLAAQPELGSLRSRQAVYFPPWDHPSLTRFYPALERLGQRLRLPGAAFLAATAWKVKAA
jgi:SAM-dependent methyltransferase